MVEAKFFKVQIYGDEWCIYKASEDDHIIADEDADAETAFYKKQIVFKQTDLYTVTHETIHAYLGYCYIATADITAHQLEEVFCELFSDKGYIILQKADEIYKKLKEISWHW